MSQGLIKAGGVFMSLLQCTLPAKQMPTSTSVSGKGVAGCACTPGPVLHPRQHTQDSATTIRLRGIVSNKGLNISVKKRVTVCHRPLDGIRELEGSKVSTRTDTVL